MVIEVGKFFIVFFAFLAQVGLLVLLKAYVLRNKPKLAPWNWAQKFLLFVKKHGLLIAAITATGAVLGSLFFSEIAKYSPCILCWYQRIFMFPQVILLWVAHKRKEAQIVWYSVPLAIIGAGFALYHYVLQLLPNKPTFGFCNPDNPCTARYIYEYAHMSIAGMALTAFIVIIVVLIMHWHYKKGKK